MGQGLLARAAPAPPSHERRGFGQFFLLDDAGTFLCGFDGDFSPVEAAACSPSRAAEALRVSADGLLCPRSAITRPLDGGFLLSLLGDFLYLHAFFAAPPVGDEPRRLLAALLAFEAAQAPGGVVHPGDRAWIHGTRAIMRRAFASPPATLVAPATPTVFVHSVLGVRGARLTLELHLRNETDAAAFDARVTFASPGGFLEPVALFGQGAEVVGSEIRLEEPLEPGVLVLMLHLEPAAPRTGPLTLRLTYRDFQGALHSVPAKPQLASASLPCVSGAEPRNSRELQACFAGADRVGDAWRFLAPPAVSPAFAFARAKEAVERERPLRVLEFSSGRPHYYEAWYVAEVGRAGPPVVVEASMWGDFSLLDLRVTAQRQADLVGLLAEYRRRLRELLSERFMGTRAPLPARFQGKSRGGPAPPGLHSPLLMRHIEGRLPASDLARALRHAQEWDAGLDADLVREFEDVMAGRGEAGVSAQAGSAPPSLPEGRFREEDFELVPGLLGKFRSLILPEIQARAEAMQGRRPPRL